MLRMFYKGCGHFCVFLVLYGLCARGSLAVNQQGREARGHCDLRFVSRKARETLKAFLLVMEGNRCCHFP